MLADDLRADLGYQGRAASTPHLDALARRNDAIRNARTRRRRRATLRATLFGPVVDRTRLLCGASRTRWGIRQRPRERPRKPPAPRNRLIRGRALRATSEPMTTTRSPWGRRITGRTRTPSRGRRSRIWTAPKISGTGCKRSGEGWNPRSTPRRAARPRRSWTASPRRGAAASSSGNERRRGLSSSRAASRRRTSLCAFLTTAPTTRRRARAQSSWRRRIHILERASRRGPSVTFGTRCPFRRKGRLGRTGQCDRSSPSRPRATSRPRNRCRLTRCWNSDAVTAAIGFLDSNVGRVLGALESSGQAANTLVVFTSDHGFSIGDHGGFGKRSLFETDTRATADRGPAASGDAREERLDLL